MIRSAVSLRLAIVELKFSTPRIISSAPLRNCSNDRITAAMGAAASEMTSENGSVRAGSTIRGHASELAYASSGSHEQTRLRSPAAASTRDTGGKYLPTRNERTG